MADRKTKAELVEALVAAGFRVISNRKEGKSELGRDKKPLTLRWIEVLVPGKMWSQDDGDWIVKKTQRANERRIYKMIKDAIGKESGFDLIDDDMGHSDTGESPDDAHVNFYAYTID